MDDTSSYNGSVIAAASLSVVSTLGVIGTCLMNHKDVIMEKLRCWISWGVQETATSDIEAAIPTRQSTGTKITFPIVINNNSGEQRQAHVTLPSPFDEVRPKLERSHSDPTFESSDHDHSPYSTSDSHTTQTTQTTRSSSDSSRVLSRRISMDV
jgi:hypothetical protein